MMACAAVLLGLTSGAGGAKASVVLLCPPSNACEPTTTTKQLLPLATESAWYGQD